MFIKKPSAATINAYCEVFVKILFKVRNLKTADLKLFLRMLFLGRISGGFLIPKRVFKPKILVVVDH